GRGQRRKRRDLPLRADQRQPRRFSPGPQSGSGRHVAGDDRAHQCATATPDFIVHTGDLTHLSKPEQFDTVKQVLSEAKVDRVFFIPGEHDVIGDNGKAFFDRFGSGAGGGWYSFDHRGVHFIALVNVLNLQAGGLGFLGTEQLAWLRQDVAGLSGSTPIVVFAHMPLWSLYPQWGWGTQDAAQALQPLKRFGSVT